MIHYYFKFQTGNTGFKKFPNLKEGDNLLLSIYYGKWKCAEKDEVGIPSQKDFRSKNQINKFFSISDHLPNVFFWLFYNDTVLCFKPVNGAVYDGPEYLFDENGSFPKGMDAKLIKSYKKYSLPEVFANINSNQKYNRLTIEELVGPERLIADSLINKNMINISHKNYFEFLSPIEFETLIFLIFNGENSFCSSFRGGTLKDFDLKISLRKHVFGLNEGSYWLQVKKDGRDNLTPSQKSTILIHLGKTDISNRILGLDWINNVISKRKDILEWLKEMTFNYEIFNFKWRQ